MKKNKVFLIVLMFILVSVSFLSGQKKVVMKEVLKPRLISMDDDQLYISETNTTILIYDAVTFKFKKKFGKTGEGPREFLTFALVTPLKDNLLINSIGKISFFTKDGVFQKEIKVPGGAGGGFLFVPIDGGYAAQSRSGGADGLYSTINAFDEKLVKTKELYRLKIGEKGFSKIDVIRSNVPYQAHKGTVFVPEKEGFAVNAIDKNGKLLFKIKKEGYKQRKFTKKIEKEIHELLKTQNPQQYQFLKDRMVFPEYFPVFSFFYKDIKTEMLYLFTWKFEDSNFECFIYDMKGKFHKRAEVPIQMQGTLQPYPMNIYDWKVYQLIDNDETENWEMHITDIKK